MYNQQNMTNSERKPGVLKRVYIPLVLGIMIGMVSVILISANSLLAQQYFFDDHIAELESAIDGYKANIDRLNKEHQAEIDRYQDKIDQAAELLDQTVLQKDAAYQKLVDDINAESSVKIEILKKYRYVIDRVNPSEGFTLGMLYYVDELCKNADINAHMVFAIFDIESDFDVDVKSAISSATGLGQVLASTGKFIYEGKMGNPKGSYSHEMAKNGYTNIEIVVTYLKYLKDTYGSISSMINSYSGDPSGGYYQKYLTQMRNNGQDSKVNYYI